ncbi:MAG: DUF4269 domain-containing protein [Oxalobacteraceae bacterium]|nr:MAG: DUF4269 domain-containing protein [Oxalobacteraceae bacterium]
MTRRSYLGAIDALNILKDLTHFDPHVAGTPPLGLHTAKSDIDILCHSVSIDHFVETLWALYSDQTGFHVWQWASDGRPVVARFTAHTWDFEIFGSAEPVERHIGRALLGASHQTMLGHAARQHAVVAHLEKADAIARTVGDGSAQQAGDAVTRIEMGSHQHIAILRESVPEGRQNGAHPGLDPLERQDSDQPRSFADRRDHGLEASVAARCLEIENGARPTARLEQHGAVNLCFERSPLSGQSGERLARLHYGNR